MKIALICGSPKGKESASHALLQGVQARLPADTTCAAFYFSTPQVPQTAATELSTFDAVVFAYPLYVDGVPAHLLSCLEQLEPGVNGKVRVYAIVNCGFYEGEQARHAISILRNWSRKAGLTWGMGIGIGGGAALFAMPSLPLGKGPTKSIGKAVDGLVSCLVSGQGKGDVFTTINMPRFLYKAAGELGWRKAIKQNGGTAKDLKKQW